MIFRSDVGWIMGVMSFLLLSWTTSDLVAELYCTFDNECPGRYKQARGCVRRANNAHMQDFSITFLGSLFYANLANQKIQRSL